MKKYLLLALISLLSLPVASAITPKLGHYVGTATIFGGGVDRKFSFDLVKSRYNAFALKNPNLPPNIISHDDRGHNDGKGYQFGHFPVGHHQGKFLIDDVVNIMFDGHARWLEDNRVAGDFREYNGVLTHNLKNYPNVYYTWHAHWVHD